MMTRSRRPGLARFLADFTLGFSDGLTVPFALTAGLSSLGRSDTVIMAGLAELCAGSISMGIGGYLSAVDEQPVPSSASNRHGGSSGGGGDGCRIDDEEELAAMLRPDDDDGSPGGMNGLGRCSISSVSNSSSSSVVDDKDGVASDLASELLIRRHLELLSLPDTAVSYTIAALRQEQHGLARAAHQLQEQQALHATRTRHLAKPAMTSLSPPTPSYSPPHSSSSSSPSPPQPVMTGLSISLGYVVGGTVPLLPYLFASTVGRGLGWSICLCLIALFAFGFGKSWLLRRGGAVSLCRCVMHGLQMLVLGGLAAAAAVACVRLLGGAGEGGATAASAS